MSFDAFRQQLAEITQKKDRAALTRMVASSFFWVPDDADIADKNLTPIDNLTKALGLDDAIGWELLAAYAGEPTAGADPQRRGIFCAPAEPTYDEKAADELADETQTDASDWGYPVRDGIELTRSSLRTPLCSTSWDFTSCAYLPTMLPQRPSSHSPKY